MKKNNKNLSWEKEQELLEEKKKKRNDKKVKVGLIIVIIILMLLLLKSCNSGLIEQLPEPMKEVINIGREDTKEGDIEINREEIQKRLNEEAMKSHLIVDINSEPVFEKIDGELKGNLKIVNDKRNFYDFYIEIHLDDTGELIYQSKIIPIGTYLEYATLSVPLEKGVYKATASFKAVHPEDSTLEGTTQPKITITVLE